MLTRIAENEPNPLLIVHRVDMKEFKTFKDHIYYINALAYIELVNAGKIEEPGNVMGTANTQRVEIYGWCNPVEPHIDTTGDVRFIYGLLLSGSCEIGVINPESGRSHKEKVKPGDVFRLNDRYPHWTKGRLRSICLFIGCYTELEDFEIIETLIRNLRRLNNKVWTAPKVAENYNVSSDGCWVTTDYSSKYWVRKEVAKRKLFDVILCANCENPAFHVDSQWPYHQDQSRCRACK